MPEGKVTEIKDILSAHVDFSIDHRTRHLRYNPQQGVPVEIEVMSAGIARIPFDTDTATFETNEGVSILLPSQLLKYKLISVWQRSSRGKKLSDWYDVFQLIKWHVSNNQRPAPDEITVATSDCLVHLRALGYSITDAEWEFIGGQGGRKR